MFLGCMAGCTKKEAESENHSPIDVIQDESTIIQNFRESSPEPPQQPSPKREYKVVHVFVALCDNQHQGIVPVPAALGNGQDPRNNLYWGAMYGVKTFFKKQSDWKTIDCSAIQPKSQILDCTAFKRKKTYLIAQAYDGAFMKSALLDFFNAAAGKYSCDFQVNENSVTKTIQAGSMADMICFVGHNGLMDIQIAYSSYAHKNPHPEWAVVLACKSNPYFSPPLMNLQCKPLITTSGFMAPEAYTLEAIIQTWSDNPDIPSIHNAAAGAYSQYQKCSLHAARKLFVPHNTTE